MAVAARPCGCTGPGTPVWREAGYTALRCACGLVFLDPLPSTASVTADRHYEGYYEFPAARRLDWVQRFCPGGRLLEVGPGAGHLLALARRRGFTVAGVDPNPASVRRIRDRLGIAVELATIEASRLPDAAFDVIVHVDLLAHLVDPVVALAAMTRRLAPGGHVCFEVGLNGDLARGWYHALGRLDFPEHRWMFSRASIDRVLGRAGLRVVGVQRFGLVPAFALVLAGRLARRVVGSPHDDPEGLPPAQGAAHRFYDQLMGVLRYRAGRIAPDLGPQTLFVAARAS
jgi:SAM-dependent methyltransferase